MTCTRKWKWTNLTVLYPPIWLDIFNGDMNENFLFMTACWGHIENDENKLLPSFIRGIKKIKNADLST